MDRIDKAILHDAIAFALIQYIDDSEKGDMTNESKEDYLHRFRLLLTKVTDCWEELTTDAEDYEEDDDD